MLLIDSGADAAAKNNEGRTSADLALFWGHAELAESIAKKAGLKLSKPPTLSLGGKGKAAGKPLISLKGGEKGKPTISLMKKEPVKIAAKDAKKKPEAESGVAMRIAAGEHVNFFAGCPLKR